MSPIKALRALAPLALSLAAACGGKDGGGTTNPPPVGGFTVSLFSTTLSVEQGAAGSVTATIARTGSFTGTVNLSTESVPAGITASFNPAAITSGTTSTTLAVNVAATVTPGAYTFTIRGQASGQSDQTATVSMTVTARPAITMTLSPTSATVVQGNNATYTATIARTNFTGAVAVNITGAPSGVTTTVSNAGDTYTVNVAVGAAVAAGVYPLTTTASGTGVTAVSATYTLTVDVPRSIALSATPSTVSVAAGLSGTTTLTLARTNFTGAVSLAASGQPGGVSLNVGQLGTGNTSAVTFNVGAAVTPGTYPVTFTATGTGVDNATVQVSLTVTAGSASIALSLSRPSLSIALGANDATSVQIARTNFTGQVNFAVSGAPSGVTATLSNTSTLTNGVTLTVAVGVSAPVGSHTITITGSGSGISNATTALSLTITQPTSGGNTSVAFCGAASDIPIWVAAQNGAGAWTQLAPGPNNTFTTNTTTTGGLAFVTQEGSSYQLFVYYGTATELSAFPADRCTTPTTRSVTGSVAGMSALDQASVVFGGRSPTTAPTQASPNFTIAGVPTGLRDLLATRSTFSLSGILVNKVFLKRDLNPPNNGSVGTVDFGGADAFDPDSKTLTLSGGGAGEQYAALAAFTTANGSTVALGTPSSFGSATTATFSAIPSSRTIAGDLHLLTGYAATLTNSIPTSFRTISAFARDATNTTLTLGAIPSTVTVTTAGVAGGAARLRAQWARQADYQDAWFVSFIQASLSVQRSASIYASPTYLGSAGNIDLAIPDFSSVAGWQQLWGIQQGTQVTWNTSSTGYVLGGGSTAEGAVFRSASRTGDHTP